MPPSRRSSSAPPRTARLLKAGASGTDCCTVCQKFHWSSNWHGPCAGGPAACHGPYLTEIRSRKRCRKETKSFARASSASDAVEATSAPRLDGQYIPAVVTLCRFIGKTDETGSPIEAVHDRPDACAMRSAFRMMTNMSVTEKQQMFWAPFIFLAYWMPTVALVVQYAVQWHTTNPDIPSALDLKILYDNLEELFHGVRTGADGVQRPASSGLRCVGRHKDRGYTEPFWKQLAVDVGNSRLQR